MGYGKHTHWANRESLGRAWGTHSMPWGLPWELVWLITLGQIMTCTSIFKQAEATIAMPGLGLPTVLDPISGFASQCTIQ